jgi:cytochrome c biogenesis protein CcmG/thiol:disulfide interchange protein DsbE
LRAASHFLVVAAAALVAACSVNTTPPAESKTSGVPVVGLPNSDAGDKAGKPADLSFTVKDMSGATVELASFKGRPLVVNFWATWCPPCKAEIPWFIEFKQKFGAQGLEILGVSIDDPAAELKTFAAEYKMNYPVLMGLDQDKLLAAYEAEVTVPVTWFIKKDGTVLGRTVGINTRQYFESQIQAIIGS